MALPDYLPGRFALARGRPSDYFALEHFHYLPKRPATYADVWVVRYDEPNVPAPLDRVLSFQAKAFPGVGVALAEQDALEARWRCDARRDAQQRQEDRSRVVAVGVLSFPGFRSLPRERALNLLDCSHRERLRFNNAHLRTISRVVVHPQFRGLGLASALVRQLIAICPTRYVESSAVMARVHPFFEAAGMRRIDHNASKHDEAAKPAYFIFDKESTPCER
ncbi:MAG TPA: GNAT family N-acetyltransferase [Tepidisphaeraceae bacterium]|nr:GNAT family N-acetyltransferase [Tepidisphaeraceae bacterium]